MSTDNTASVQPASPPVVDAVSSDAPKSPPTGENPPAVPPTPNTNGVVTEKKSKRAPFNRLLQKLRPKPKRADSSGASPSHADVGGKRDAAADGGAAGDHPGVIISKASNKLGNEPVKVSYTPKGILNEVDMLVSNEARKVMEAMVEMVENTGRAENKGEIPLNVRDGLYPAESETHELKLPSKRWMEHWGTVLLDKLFAAHKMGVYVVTDRATGAKIFETMPIIVRLGIHLLFVSTSEEILDLRVVEKLFYEMSVRQGRIYDNPDPAYVVPHIEGFIKTYNIALNELLEPDVKKYRTFNDFFKRSLKPSARPVAGANDPTIITSAADSRLTVFQNVDDAKKFWIKGKEFSIATLLDDPYLAKTFGANPSIAIFRLAPQDYHRFHSPFQAKLGKLFHIPGTYYTVNPQAVNEDLNVFTANRRDVHLMYATVSPPGPDGSSTPVQFALVAVGAMLVGSIGWSKNPGDEAMKGEDLGFFQYGGSTVILVAPEGTVQWDEDILKYSSQSPPLETLGGLAGTPTTQPKPAPSKSSSGARDPRAVARNFLLFAFAALCGFVFWKTQFGGSTLSPAKDQPTSSPEKGSDPMVFQGRPRTGKLNIAYRLGVILASELVIDLWPFVRGIYGRKYPPSLIPAENLTHLLYAFANVKSNGEVFLSDAWADQDIHYPGDSWNDSGTNLYGNFKQIYLLKKRNRHLKLMLSIGGWTYSPNFHPVVVNSNARKEFVRSSIKILEDYGLDGLDVDYEYPGDNEQARGYTELLRLLREGLDAHARKKGGDCRFELSIAAPCGPSNYEKLHAREMDRYLDMWNLMAYGGALESHYSGSWEKIANHQANVHKGPINTEMAVKWYTDQGIPRHKLIIGVPLYGRSFMSTQGPGHPFSGVGPGSWEAGSYDYRALPLPDSVVHRDARAMASWSYDPQKQEMISFDDALVAKWKAEWICKEEFGGAMYWELSGDKTGPQENGRDGMESGPGKAYVPGPSIVQTVRDAFGGLDESRNWLEYGDNEQGKQFGYSFLKSGIYKREYYPSLIPVENLTHVLYAFADLKPDTGEVFLSDNWADQVRRYPGDPLDDSGTNLYGNLKQMYLLKKRNRHLKLMLSIGGWTWSPKFYPVVVNLDSRKEFVRSSIKILEDYGLDGLDVAYRFARQPNREQASGYTELLRMLREALDAHARKKGGGCRFELSIAAPCASSIYEKLHVREMDCYLDMWNLLAYGYAGSWGKIANHHANVYQGTINTEKAVKWYMDQGIPRHKLIIGVSLYGRSFLSTEGLGNPFSGVGPGSWEAGIYDCRALPLPGAIVDHDEKAMASWSYDAEKQEVISFDDALVAKWKAEWVCKEGFGGMMYLELSGDKTGPQENGRDGLTGHGKTYVPGPSVIETVRDVFGWLDESRNWLEYGETLSPFPLPSSLPSPPPMLSSINLRLALAAAGLIHVANALTIYTSIKGSIPTQFLGPDGQYTGLPAFDPVQQTAPAPPQPAVPTAVALALPTGSVPGLNGKQHRTDYVGISIEMSVSDRIIGHNGTFLNPIFLNHIQNLHARSGKVSIRVGGNSQEKASLIPAWYPNIGPTINKTTDPNIVTGFVNSPLLTISEDLIYAMSNISSLVNVGWYYGLPFLNEQEIATVANGVSAILGSNLEGFQMANEPDLYQAHGKKPPVYDIPAYMADWARVRSTYIPTRTDLIAPNVCCSWKIDDILAAGFLQQFAQYLQFVAVQHYKDAACTSTTVPVILTSQQAYDSYLSHTAVTNFFLPYKNASIAINAAGKDFVLLETNTASCGGFAGASDSYAAALYLIDISLQAASIGIAQVLLHNGGVGQYYNLFTPPPGNMTSFREWTTSAPYYSALIMAEAMSEQGSQVMDLTLNGNNTNTPGYAIYRNGVPVKLALFNYITDPSGANDITVQVSVAGVTPSSVKVKYFDAPNQTTADKFNLTWAGQTMGDQFTSDGRLQGQENTVVIQCAGSCNIPVKAPQFALVFLDSNDNIDPVLSTQTWATTTQTKLVGAALVPPSVLATSNGRGGAQEAFNFGGTSQGAAKSSAEVRAVVKGGVAVFLGLVSGIAFALMR
ncbi:Endochitinase 1 [Tulasnella sp. 403]|nr:Endochitinase 1 [Tulasnella sp. 403]